MNDPVAHPDKLQLTQSEAIRKVQDLIDKENALPGDGLIDNDAEACIKLLAVAQTVDLHLLPAAWDLKEASAGSSETPSHVQRWTLRYESLLGSGGFAVVLAVTAMPSGQTFAMKILRPSLRWSKSHQKRFLQEAELTALLSGDGIVPVIATGLIGSNPFILSEYVDGPNLGQFLAAHSSGLDVSTAVGWARSLAQTLQLAHEAGILHRDLKPENVLLQRRSDDPHLTPRITDFGLARRFQQSAAYSADSSTGNMLVGTARYMAPEVATGRIHTGSIPADVYSLAAILFQCVTGRAPFDGRGFFDVVTRMQSAPAPSACQLNPQVSASLSTVLQKALCRAPHLRYQTAAEFDADLERVQQGQQVAALQSRLTRLLWEFTTSHPRAATAFFVMTLILPIAVVAMSVLYYREKSALEQHRELLQVTMTSVRDYINLSEKVLKKYPASIEDRYDTLKKALAVQELVAQGLDYNAESRYRISLLHSLLADAAWRASDPELSGMHVRTCLSMLDDLLRDEPSNLEYRFDVFYNRMCLEHRSQYETNEERTAAKRETLRAIQDLVERSPDEPDFIDALASSYCSLGQHLTYTTTDDGTAELERAIEISDDLWPKHPQKLLYTKYSLTGRATLADFHRRHGNLERSEELASEAIAILKSIQHPDRNEVWFQEIVMEPYSSYAATVRELGRWHEAEVAFRECCVIEDQLYENNPLHAHYALGRANFAAEELRAARKGQAGVEKLASLRQKAEERLDDLRKADEASEYIQVIERLISDPDAPPIR